MATNNRVVHEGVIKDIVDLLTDTKAVKELRNSILPGSNNSTYISNVAKFTSNLVLTFPVIVDESVPISTASLVAKSVEHRVVSMLQMLFSAIDISNNANAFTFISKVHQNLTSDDIVSFINKMDSLPLTSKKHESVDIEEINKIMLKCIKEDNVVLNNDIPLGTCRPWLVTVLRNESMFRNINERVISDSQILVEVRILVISRTSEPRISTTISIVWTTICEDTALYDQVLNKTEGSSLESYKSTGKTTELAIGDRELRK